MINHKDVRIDNLVMYDNRVFKIHTIAEEFPTLDTTEFGIGVVGWDDLEPIPLTEEWLLECGFEKNDIKEFYYIDIVDYRIEVTLNGFSGTLEKEPNWWISINTGYGSQPVTIIREYVHQLQTLYFALTGMELTIKE